MTLTAATSEVVQLRPAPGHSELAITADQTFWTDQQLATLRQLGMEEAGDGDLAVFFHQATRTGLDPFAKQIYMIGRNQQENGRWIKKWTIQTGIDGFRLIARRAADAAREHLSYEDTFWRAKGGTWTDSWDEEVPPSAAKVVVLRDGDRFPAVAHYREFVQTNRDGRPNSMWARMPSNQLAKCAEALALRKAFPQDLSGIYTDDEMGQADARAEREAAEQQERTSTRRPVRTNASRVVDGEIGSAPESSPEELRERAKQTPQEWAAALAACAEERDTWPLYKRADFAGQLGLDIDGLDLGDAIKARAEKLREGASQPAAAVSGPPAAAQPAPAAEEPLLPEPPAEEPLGEIVDAEIVPAEEERPDPAEDPADMCRSTGRRRAVENQLMQIYGGEAAAIAAIEDWFSVPHGKVATARLEKLLAREQRLAAR